MQPRQTLQSKASLHVLPICADHQLLRKPQLLQAPTQAKDISKPAYICVCGTSGVEREVTVLFELPCPKPLVVSANHGLYHLIIWSIAAAECTYISSISAKGKYIFPFILPLENVHARGCCGGSGGGQICHDG